jgi:hypothetical protein
MNLHDLHAAINATYVQPYTREQELERKRLFDDNYIPAVINEGLNEATAKAIYSQAWERGHSSGYCEVINFTHDLIELAKRIIAANP